MNLWKQDVYLVLFFQFSPSE